MPRLYNLNSHKLLRRQLRNNPTPSERKLWRYLKGRQFHGLVFHRQHGIGRYIVDFYCPKLRLVIEVDGSVHENSEVQKYDAIRRKFLEESCYLRVVRFTNDEVMEDVEEVLKKMEKIVTAPTFPLLN